MNEKKKVLGRGLGALIGEAEKLAAPKGGEGREKFRFTPLDDISPSRLQPRKSFDEARLAELSESIKEKGVIEPLLVRRDHAGGFELIAGERRWRAARMAGLKEVPIILIDASDEESLEYAIIENIQREDLNPVEEAEAYSHLLNFGLSQEEVARKVGKERATVANYLRLLKLPPEVKEEIVKGTLTMGHARAILAVPGHAAQTELCRRIITKGLSVREAEALTSRPGRRKASKNADPESLFIEDELRRIFGTKINLKERGGKGKIEILYFSPDERERILELLRTAR